MPHLFSSQTAAPWVITTLSVFISGKVLFVHILYRKDVPCPLSLRKLYRKNRL